MYSPSAEGLKGL